MTAENILTGYPHKREFCLLHTPQRTENQLILSSAALNDTLARLTFPNQHQLYHCTLKKVSLDDAPKYEALYDTWGPQTNYPDNRRRSAVLDNSKSCSSAPSSYRTLGSNTMGRRHLHQPEERSRKVLKGAPNVPSLPPSQQGPRTVGRVRYWKRACAEETGGLRGLR